MKQDNREIGRLTEGMAAEYLAQKGYQVLERNFSNKFGEIDVIVKDRDVLVFVEVKAKTGIECGLPEEMISKGKLQKIRHMGILYTNGHEVKCRIDVIAIVLNRDHSIQRLSHYINVY